MQHILDPGRIHISLFSGVLNHGTRLHLALLVGAVLRCEDEATAAATALARITRMYNDRSTPRQISLPTGR